jgi:hypothetical protein
MKTLIALDENRDRLRVKTMIAFRENPHPGTSPGRL